MMYSIVICLSVALTFVSSIANIAPNGTTEDSNTFSTTTEERYLVEVMVRARVAAVTGGNKGIGYAIVKGLCEKYEGIVYLTARDESKGLAAVKSLNELGLEPRFHVLDITNKDSITKFRDYIMEEYGGLDVLVNNAAIAFKVNAKEPFGLQAKETIHVNYFSLKLVCDILFPILRAKARIVNLSSSAGHLSRIPSQSLREKLSSPSLTEPELSSLMNSFVQAAQTGAHQEQGWPDSAYSVSKTGVVALSLIQQREFDKNESTKYMIVNAVHPGYVATDMSSHKGPLTIEEGAVSSLYAALIPEYEEGPKGSFIWSDKRVVNWAGPLPPVVSNAEFRRK